MKKSEETMRHEVWLSSSANRRKIKELQDITGMSKSEILRRLLDGMTVEELAMTVLPDLKVESRKK